MVGEVIKACGGVRQASSEEKHVVGSELSDYTLIKNLLEKPPQAKLLKELLWLGGLAYVRQYAHADMENRRLFCGAVGRYLVHYPIRTTNPTL